MAIEMHARFNELCTRCTLIIHLKIQSLAGYLPQFLIMTVVNRSNRDWQLFSPSGVLPSQATQYRDTSSAYLCTYSFSKKVKQK